MKNAPGQTGAGSERAEALSLPRGPRCPDAPECRSITPNDHADSAACNFCGQHLDRAALLELYTGRS